MKFKWWVESLDGGGVTDTLEAAHAAAHNELSDLGVKTVDYCVSPAVHVLDAEPLDFYQIANDLVVAIVRHIKNLSEVFLKNGTYHRSYYVKPFASWVPHWIPSDVESLQCQTVNLTPPATAPIPKPTGNHDQPPAMIPNGTFVDVSGRPIGELPTQPVVKVDAPLVATLAIKAGAYHATEAIAITVQALHDDAAHTTEVLLNLLTELSQVLVALDAPDHVLDQVWAAIEDQPLPYESLLPFITKHQAISNARRLGLSDEELKAMGVEV